MTKRDEIFCYAVSAAATVLLAALAFAVIEELPKLIRLLK